VAENVSLIYRPVSLDAAIPLRNPNANHGAADGSARKYRLAHISHVAPRQQCLDVILETFVSFRIAAAGGRPMRQILSILVMSIVLVLVEVIAGTALVQNTETAYAQSNSSNERICCQRGDEERWRRDSNACRSGGGLVVPERMCSSNDRTEVRVCCQRGDEERWSNGRNACRSDGGRVVNERLCSANDRAEARVCCRRGDEEHWRGNRNACRSGGGLVVPERMCASNDRTEVPLLW
jgi:hypothetical protein